jgi:hypothetical protein
MNFFSKMCPSVSERFLKLTLLTDIFRLFQIFKVALTHPKCHNKNFDSKKVTQKSKYQFFVNVSSNKPFVNLKNHGNQIIESNANIGRQSRRMDEWIG